MSSNGKNNGEYLKKSFQSVSKSTLKTANISPSSSGDNLSQTCSVCAEAEPKFWSVSPCNHKICWICSLRLRALYDSKACPICKNQADLFFICKRPEDAEEFFKNKNSKFLNSSLSISYDNEVTRSTCEALLQIQCPFNAGSAGNNSCKKHFKSKLELRKHVQNVHELQLCEICLEHKKCFTVELALYNRTSLQKHQRDANHPRCQVCDRIFYSEDELAEHCRDEHELCHICQRSGRPNRFFQNYTRLEEHFGKEHYLCPEPLCKELKFVVFENELEYKAHQAEVHLAHQKLQRSQQRQLQRLNISFTGAGSTTAESTISNDPIKQPSLTSDQRNQIGANLIYGQVTDDLANRLQSLSLYQSRNDEFIEILRGTTFHLNQIQIQSIFQAARTFQSDECSATEFILKIEKIVQTSDTRNLIKMINGLADLQLDEMKRQRLNVAIQGYQVKCSDFPELLRNNKNNKNSNINNNISISNNKKSVTWAPNTKNPVNQVEYLGDDPFGFARTISKPPGLTGSSLNMSSSPFSSTSVKILQIVKPSNPPNPLSKTSDPSRNPALLLSQLAGGPSLKNASKKKSTGTVKMTTFSSAAMGSGSVNTSPSKSQNQNNLNEAEFPTLNGSGSGASTSAGTSKTTTVFNTKTSGENAFFAPSDRDQLESFTIGNDDGKRDDEPSVSGSIKKEKKSKKVVFRYGQKWDV